MTKEQLEAEIKHWEGEVESLEWQLKYAEYTLQDLQNELYHYVESEEEE